MSRRERAKAAWDRWPGVVQLDLMPQGSRPRASYVAGYYEGEREAWKRARETLQAEAHTYRMNGEITPYIATLLAWVDLQLK